MMGLEVIYPKPKTGKPYPGRNIYPCMLKGIDINRPDMVWASDITYILLIREFMYLVTVMWAGIGEKYCPGASQTRLIRILCIRYGRGDRRISPT
jgi:hypothetical protein